MAQRIRLLPTNRQVVLQEPEDAQDVFLRNLGNMFEKYSSPEYQNMQRKQERDDARLVLEKRKVDLAEESYKDGLEIASEERAQKQANIDREYNLNLSTSKGAAYRQGKTDIDNFVNSLPISEFIKGDDYLNGLMEGVVEYPDELLGLNPRINSYAKSKIKSKVNHTKNIYNMANRFQKYLPENYDVNMIAQSLNNNTFDSISKQLFENQQLTPRQKFLAEAKIKQITALNKSLSEIDPSSLEGKEGKAIRGIKNNYEINLKTAEDELESLLQTSPSLRTTIINIPDEDDLGETGVNFASNIKEKSDEINKRIEERREQIENVFASDEEIQTKRMNEAILTAQGEGEPVFGSDAPMAEETDVRFVDVGGDKIPKAWLEKAGSDSLSNLFPSLNEKGKEDFSRPDVEVPGEPTPDILPDVEPDDLSRLLQEQSEKSREDVLDNWNQKMGTPQKSLGVPGKTSDVDYKPYVGAVSKLISALNKSSDRYYKTPDNKTALKSGVLKAITQRQKKLRDMLVPWISPETGSFGDSKFDARFYKDLSRRTGIEIPILKEIILSNVSYNI